MSAVVQATASASAPTPAPAATADDTSMRFLVELDKTWSICRLYGTEHPAFHHGARAAAAALDRTIQVSISPKGFSIDRAPVGDGTATANDLRMLAQRLRRMGLVGLTAEAGLTPSDVAALVIALHEADRGRAGAGGDAVAKVLAAATGGRVRALPLRLGDLNLVAGTAAPLADADLGEDPSALWHELFSTACFGRSGPAAAGVADAARALEAAMGGVQSRAHWDAMVGAWLKELSTIDAAPSPSPTPSPSPATTTASTATTSGSTAPTPPVMPDAATRIDAVASFLKALSPAMSQRLLGETIGSSAAPSEHVMLALTNQLPAGVVLGALSAIDRTGAAPSSAALAVLRSVSAHVMDHHGGGRDGSDGGAWGAGGASGASNNTSPRTNAELAEIGASLERLLGSNQERSFVPEEYLRRRDELTRGVVRSGRAAPAVVCPTESQTSRHAAGVVLEMLASADASPGHLVAGLQFLSHRIGDWIRGGAFDLVGHAADVGRTLSHDADPAVAGAAQSLLEEGLAPDELISASRHCPDRATAVAGLAELLRHGDGAALINLLRSPKLAASGAAGTPLVEAVRQVLPSAGDACFKRLLGATFEPTAANAAIDGSGPKCVGVVKDALPAALLPILATLREPDAIRAVEAMLPHASTCARHALAGELFRRNVRWPLSLTDQLLRDVKPGIRRLAVMRLVRDNDLATAGRYLAAASVAGTYATDVAVGLAELLRHDRRHPDVRGAYRRWFWSRRRWVSLLAMDIGSGKEAA